MCFDFVFCFFLLVGSVCHALCVVHFSIVLHLEVEYGVGHNQGQHKNGFLSCFFLCGGSPWLCVLLLCFVFRWRIS